MKMKRQHWVVLIAAVATIFPLVHIVGIARRDAQYRAILKTYSDVLKPGMTRGEVENYFIMSRYVSFDKGCIRPNCGAYADLVEIGRENAGWVCQDQIVSAAFEFATAEPDTKWVDSPGDRLVRISLFRSDCLDLP